jgi:hypothetical protein
MNCRKILGCLIIIFLASCAGPKTVSEFVNKGENSSLFERSEFTIDNVPFSEAKQRLMNIAEECYQFENRTQERAGMHGGIAVGKVKYSVELQNKSKPASFQMAVRRVCIIECGLNEDDSGTIALVADLVQISKNKTAVKILGLKYGYGNMLRDTTNWLKNESKLCPTFTY